MKSRPRADARRRAAAAAGDRAALPRSDEPAADDDDGVDPSRGGLKDARRDAEIDDVSKDSCDRRPYDARRARLRFASVFRWNV